MSIFQLLSREQILQLVIDIQKNNLADITSLNTVFKQVVELNHVDAVKSLLQDSRVDPSITINHDSPITFASEKGYVEIVKLLLSDKRVDPSIRSNYAIQYACQNGHVEIVRLLLQDPRVTPHCTIIRLASVNNHLEVVKLLLQDKRIDPSFDNNVTVRHAFGAGHIEIVELLLQDSRVNPGCLNNCMIRDACKDGKLETVKLLLRCPRVNPATTQISGPTGGLIIDRSSPLLIATEMGHIEVVELLLQDSRVDPTIGGNEAILLASKFNRPEIIKLLLRHPKINIKEITDHKILDIAKSVSTITNTPQIQKENELLILNLMRDNNIYKIHIKDGGVSFSYNL